MLINGQLIFKLATGLYGLSLICSFACGRRSRAGLFFLIPALLTNAMAVAHRFWTAWPMLPMYASPLTLPLFMGGVVACNRASSSTHARTMRGVLILTVIIALTGVLFPKDYYIPFIKSQTIWAHLFFWFGLAGRGCFLIAAAWAMTALAERTGEPEYRGQRETESRRGGEGETGRREKEGRRTMDDGRNRRISVSHPSTCVPRPTEQAVSPSPHQQISPASRALRWIVWGFAFWTLSMFTGEMWSYLGWGTPVVWDDPAITTTMATWFFYICLLHLHLTGSWTARGRAAYTAFGGLVVLVLNGVPELGPLRWPL